MPARAPDKSASGNGAADGTTDCRGPSRRKGARRILGIIGIVEDYKTSARRFQAKYASEFPGLDFVDVRANRTSTGIPDVESATRAMHEELGTGLFDRLVEANQLDLELYDWAVRRFPRFEDEGSRRPVLRKSASELADENEKLRDEVRYLTAEWETLVSRLDELAAQHHAIVGIRDREIAAHEALARAHNDLIARHDTLVQIRNDEIAAHEALARAHNDLSARHDTLVQIRNDEIAAHEALARVHNDLIDRHAALVQVRNGEIAEHEALARAHNDLIARHAALVQVRNIEIADHEALARVHNDLIDQHAALLHIRNGETAEHEALACGYRSLVAERDALVRERDAMLASRSWRLTSPLRWVRNLFTRSPVARSGSRSPCGPGRA